MAQLDESAQLNDDAPRCPRCAKRLSAEMTACPTCGYELLPHRARITCKRCGSRILANVTLCPRCNKDPRVGRVPPIVPRIIFGAFAFLLIVCIGWIIFRVVATNVIGHALGWDRPTPVPTQVVQVMYVVASPILPTPTPTLPPTPTKFISPTPTKRGARPAPTAIVATPLPPGFYPAVMLLGPANTTVYGGPNASILLEWQSIAPNGLRENEWYEIKLTFAGRTSPVGEYRRYSKETRWTVPADMYKEISADARTVKWFITVVRVQGIDPFPPDNRTYISVASATRSFIWNP